MTKLISMVWNFRNELDKTKEKAKLIRKEE
jgi:hypothetical protein